MLFQRNRSLYMIAYSLKYSPLMMALLVLICVGRLNADVVTLNTSDASGTSSYTGSTNWSNGNLPSATNDYVDGGFTLRTPNNAVSYPFPGHSLTVSSPGTTGILALKASGGTVTYAFGTNAVTGLTLDGGTIGLWNGISMSVAGFITVTSNGGVLDPQANYYLIVPASIGGPGALRLDTQPGQNNLGGIVRLSGSNSYTGGTIIDMRATLQLSGSATLGAAAGWLTIVNTNSPAKGYGTVDLNGTSQTIGNLSGTGGSIVNSAATTTSALTIGNGNAGGGNFQGVITDAGGKIALVKAGTGVITLAATNAYTGGTTISNGTLQVCAASGSFSGSGTLVLMAPSAGTVQTLTAGGIPFSGKWIVASGWLAGATNEAFGTNSSILVDPRYPLDPSAGNPALSGDALFEPLYDLNSAGTLVLTNGGQMILHQNCAFAAVTVQGTQLSLGTHSYAELNASFPSNFPSGGAGYVTVQPYGALPSVSQAPQFTTQPASQTNYNGATVQFSAMAFGNPAPAYQWMAGVPGSGVYSNLANGGQFSGVTTSVLIITNISAANDGNYIVVATNSSGSTNSLPAMLTILPSSTVAAYPVPAVYAISTTYTLTINGVAIPVVSYTGDYDYATCSLSNGRAAITVTALTQSSISSYGISPQKLTLSGTTQGNQLIFAVTNHQYLIVQINSLKRLIIAADPPETAVPPSSGDGVFNVLTSPYNADNTGSTKTSAAIQAAINDASAYGNSNGQGIVYVPSGLYSCGNLKLKENMALYLQGGAVIRGTGNPADYITNTTYGPLATGTWLIYITNGSNTKIYGRGMVDAQGGYMVNTEKFAVNTLMPINCTNFTADGITFRDAGGWTIIPCLAANVILDNLKIFNQFSVGNDDGIDANCSQNVMVTNVLAIGLDDTFSTKTYTTIPWTGYNMVNSNIVFNGCLAWTICYGFKVGQGVDQLQTEITFENGVVYDCAGAIGIDHKYGTFPVNNVTFDTIDVENISQVNAGHGAWAVFLVENASGDGGGPVSNLWVGNITVRNAGTTGGFIQGYSSFASVDNVTFDNIYMPGSSIPASTLYQMAMTNVAFYNNVTILPVKAPEPLLIMSQPASQSQYTGQTATFTVSAWGNQPLVYQWQVQSNQVYVNLNDGGKISGSQTATLSIANIASPDGTNYLVKVWDAYDAPITSAAANLIVIPPLGPPVNATMSTIEPNESPAVDWNSGSFWSNGLTASNTAVAYPGSTFEILPGGGMRTPYNVSGASFPGNILTVDGNGVWNSTANIGQIMLKNSGGGTVNFPDLTMKGGQINNYVDSAGTAEITGLMNVVSNAPISAGNTGSGGTIQIGAHLNGAGSIEYHGYSSSTFQPTWVCDLDISGTNNGFSGTWNVVTGTLMGSGVNALGTNNIAVGASGALQTTYDIFSPGGSLTLNGRINLTQNDTFKSVVINGVPLSAGYHSFTSLNAAFPGTFPSSWTGQPGGTATNGSGSLTVLPTGAVVVTSHWNGNTMTLMWPEGVLLQATNIIGPWTTNIGAASPFPVVPGGPQMFYQIKVR